MDVNILLADDHQLFRDGLRALLEKERGLKIVGEASDGLEVMSLIAETRPHIVCMDVAMPGMNGIETSRRLQKLHPDIRVIGISGLGEARHVREMLEAGAHGYLTKAAAGEQLIKAIRAVMQGQRYICPEAERALKSPQAQRTALPRGEPAPILSSRERQVLQLVAEGHTSTGIAGLLRMSPSTVDVHRRNIMRKLNLHSVAELTKYAIREGLTSS